MASHSSTLAWKILWTEEVGRLQSMGSGRVGHDWMISLSLFTFHALEKEMATHSSVLTWRIPGTGEPGGLSSMGWHRVRHDWSDLATAAAAVATLSNKLLLTYSWLFSIRFTVSPSQNSASFQGFPGGSVVKNPPANSGDAGDLGSIPESGRSRGEGNGNLLQCSYLQNSMDKGA